VIEISRLRRATRAGAKVLIDEVTESDLLVVRSRGHGGFVACPCWAWSRLTWSPERPARSLSARWPVEGTPVINHPAFTVEVRAAHRLARGCGGGTRRGLRRQVARSATPSKRSAMSGSARLVARAAPWRSAPGWRRRHGRAEGCGWAGR
jgi:hypothetical protein